MALTLLFQSRKAKIDALELDAMITAEHVVENEITAHPVEVGAEISDHVRAKPDRLTIEGIVSSAPAQFGGANDTDRVSSAHLQLLALRDDAKLISVVTRRRSYDSFVIESIRFSEDSKMGDSLHFSAALRQIRTVTSQTVQITNARAKSKTKGGKKTADKATAQQEKKASFLMKLKQYAQQKWSGKP